VDQDSDVTHDNDQEGHVSPLSVGLSDGRHPRQHLHRFSHFTQLLAERPYGLQWADPFSPDRTIPCMGDLNPHLMHGSLGLSESITKQHLDRFSCFCRAQIVTDRQTDHTILSVTMHSILRCGPIIITTTAYRQTDTSSYILVAVQTACNVIKTSRNTKAEVTTWMR